MGCKGTAEGRALGCSTMGVLRSKLKVVTTEERKEDMMRKEKNKNVVIDSSRCLIDFGIV